MRSPLVLLLATLLGMWLLLAPAPAHAQSCSPSASNMAFGSINTVNNQQYVSSSSITVSCSGTPNAQVRICPYIASGSGGAAANGPRNLVIGSNVLIFDIFTSASFSQRYANNVAAGSNPESLITLNGTGSAIAVIVLYGRIPANQTGAPAGVYSSVFGSPTKVQYGYATAFGSCAAAAPAEASFSFTASASNNTSCTLTTSSVAFPSTSAITGNVDTAGALQVTCSQGVSYTIVMDGGANGGTSATTRRMKNGTSYITYGLFRDAARSQPWYTDAGGTYSGSASGGAQSISVYGRVPNQTTPPAGSYIDSVVVTVTY